MSGDQIELTFKAVGSALGVITILKIALDIATSPAHRSTGFKWLLIARDIASPVFLGIAWSLILGTEFMGWACVFVSFSLMASGFTYLLGSEPARRADTAYLVMMQCMGYYALVSMLFLSLAQRITAMQ